MPRHHTVVISAALLLAAINGPSVIAADNSGATEELRGNYHFLLEVGGEPAGHFQSVSGLAVESEVVEYREGGDTGLIRKLKGPVRYSNIVLRRGYVPEGMIREWIGTNLNRNGTADRRDGALVLLDQSGHEVVRYEFFHGWPCRWSGFTPDNDSGVALLEEVEICIDWFEEVLAGEE